MATKTDYPHILLDDAGVPVIEGTTMKVVELVATRMAYGWSPEELEIQYPYLTPAQIHAALAYHWDHAANLDADIDRRVREAETLRGGATRDSALSRRLRAQGRH